MLDLQIDFPPDPEKAGNSSKSINNKGTLHLYNMACNTKDPPHFCTPRSKSKILNSPQSARHVFSCLMTQPLTPTLAPYLELFKEASANGTKPWQGDPVARSSTSNLNAYPTKQY